MFKANMSELKNNIYVEAKLLFAPVPLFLFNLAATVCDKNNLGLKEGMIKAGIRKVVVG